MAKHLDVLIVGGGMVGATLAYALGRSTPELAIGIVEPFQRNDQYHPSFDDRVIALAAGSVASLAQLGIWEHGASQGTPIEYIEVTDCGHPGHTSLHGKDHGQAFLGQVIASKDYGATLNKKLDAFAQIQWFCPDTIKQINRSQDQVSVELNSGELLTCRLLVAADGGSSATRDMLHIPVINEDYQQSALIANVELDRHHQFKAYERFTQSGPLALLPMQGNRMSLVWSLKPEDVAEFEQMTDKAFLQALQDKAGYRCGKFNAVSRRVIYPLTLIKAQVSVSHRCVLIGNASHSIHPIAGQGFNLGVRDIVQLHEEILAAIANNQDIGSYPMLVQYQKKREADQISTIQLTDTLVRVFSNDYLPLVLGRNVGLTLLNKLPYLKSKLANRAMGGSAT